MSFPRARIQRFNECPNDAPPPGSYDPKFKSKIKGPLLEKLDRCLDSKSVSSSCADCNTSNSSRATSVTAIPAFKVPQLPKRKVPVKSSSLHGLKSSKTDSSKKKPTTPSKDAVSKYDASTELADLKVECLNKDRTIGEYEKQIEEMKEEILHLEKQLTELKEKQNEIETQHRKNIEEMIQERRSADVEMRTKIQKMHEEFETEICKMRAEESKLKNELNNLADIRADLESKLRQRQHIVIQLQSQLSMLECELDECRAENENMQAECERKLSTLSVEHSEETNGLKKEFDRVKEELNSRVEREVEEKLRLQCSLESESSARQCADEKLAKIQCLHADVKSRLKEAEDELREMSDHHAQVLTNHSEEIETLMSRHAEEVSRLMMKSEEFKEQYTSELRKAIDTETKTDQLVLDAKKSVEEEVEKAVEQYSAALTLVETQSKFFREKVEEKESEIVQLAEILEELRECLATKESSNQSLQTELDRAEAELAEKRDEVRSLKDQLRNEAAEMVTRRRRLDVVMAENQATVVALSQRLAHSDAEVERLQGDLDLEKQRLAEHRDLLNSMRANTADAHEHMQTLLRQLDDKREDLDQLVVDNLVKFDAMKVMFDDRMKELNDIAATEITRLREDCEKKNIQNKELRQQLADMSEKLENARDMLLKVEEHYDAQGVELAQLQLSHRNLVESYNELNEKYEEANSQMLAEKLTIEEKRSSAKMVEQAFKETEATAKSDAREKLQQELDIAKIRADRDILESRLSEIETEYKELADKYAAAIGHNNQKQKIQHMIQMKSEKLQLKEEMDAAKRTIAQQQRIIEKLRSEERHRLHSREKENLPSPHKPSTPLKDRNI